MTPSPTSPPQPPTQGSSFVVVLLVSVVIFSAITAVSALMAVRSHTTGEGESSGYGAFLAAESGLQALTARTHDQAAADDYFGPLTVENLNTWMVDQGYATTTLPNGATAFVQAVRVNDQTGEVIVKSSGRYGTARRTLLLDFIFKATTPIQAFATPGAITSYPSVDTNGQPVVVGQAPSASGIFTRADSAQRIRTASSVNLPIQQWTDTFTLSVRDPAARGLFESNDTSSISVGTYLTVRGETYKVISKTSTTVQLRPVRGPSDVAADTSVSIGTGDEIQLLPNAVTETLRYAGGPLSVPVTRPDEYLLGDVVNIDHLSGTQVGTTNGRVINVDRVNRRITLSFDAPLCPVCSAPPVNATISEATPLVRSVVGISSAGYVDPPKSGSEYTYLNLDSRVPNPYPADGRNRLFQQTFGMQPATFFEAYPPRTLTNLSAVSGVTVVQGGSWNGSSGLCGSGILVVVGDFEANSAPTCPEPFRGLIYVTGNVKLMGNLALNGSLVAQGTVTSPDVSIGGSKTADKVQYDPFALLDSGSLLRRYTLAPNFGTWREH